MLRYIWAMILCLLPMLASAQDKIFALSAPPELVETGLLKHVLPRFSLKTGIRIELSEGATAARLGLTEGIPVFERDGTVWRLSTDDSPLPLRFANWLTSDVGKRAIESFTAADGSTFVASDQAIVVAAAPTFEGDAVAGETLSLSLCGRCHVVNETNRMNAIGSTPSFAVLRTFDTWQERFETFYVLKPHGAFTQVAGVTPPFDPSLPSPIVPIELTQTDLEAIIAYVSTVSPADLGAPVQSQ